MSVNEKMTAIADAIRAKTGKTGVLSLDDMVTEIVNIRDAQSEYDLFWDAYQQNGDRGDYNFSFFGVGWNANNFKPKYDINVSTGEHMFDGSDISSLDLRQTQFQERFDVGFDTSQATNLSYWLQGSSVVAVGEVNAINLGTLKNVFYGATNLRTIEKIIMPPKSTTSVDITDAFFGCVNLEDIAFEGVIANDISFADSPNLTVTSVNIILDRLASVSSMKTIKFHSAIYDNLTTSQRNTILYKNWGVTK